jgi:hypothetical protein
MSEIRVSSRSLLVGVLCAVTLLLSSSVALSAPLTTAPQATFFDRVILTNKGITLGFKTIQRGDLVVFKVHNGSSRRERFVLKPGVNLGAAQGGSGFQTKLLKPGELATFQVEFSNRGTFRYYAEDGAGKSTSPGKFLIT